MLPVATAIQRGAPKINACVQFVRVLCKTRRSFIRSFSRLSQEASYLRTGVKGCSKIRLVLAKSRLFLDEMCRLYGKFVSDLRRVLCKKRLIFPRINAPILLSMVLPCTRFARESSAIRVSMEFQRNHYQLETISKHDCRD